MVPFIMMTRPFLIAVGIIYTRVSPSSELDNLKDILRLLWVGLLTTNSLYIQMHKYICIFRVIMVITYSLFDKPLGRAAPWLKVITNTISTDTVVVFVTAIFLNIIQSLINVSTNKLNFTLLYVIKGERQLR